MDIVPFDMQRMFFGSLPLLFLLEIAFRTLLMYGYTLLAVRFLGKRGTGQLTMFDFIVVILLGSATGDPMLYDDVPLIYGFIVITVVVLMERLLNFMTNRHERLEEIVESTPTLLVLNGRIVEKSLASQEISRNELMMELRQHGIRNTGEVERAYVEPSGRVSVFTYEKDARVSGDPTFPEL